MKIEMENKLTVNESREDKRQAKFARKREEGRAYTYAPNPYRKGTNDYIIESIKRAEKSKSKKTPVAQWKSIMAKLDNELAAKKNKIRFSKNRSLNK